jgi:hypothetical protein
LNLPSTAVGRRVLGTGCRSLVRPILLSAVLPPLTHRQAIGLSHHTEAFSEGYGVDGTHFKMIMDHADSASVLRDYGVSSVKEQIQLRAHWDRIGTSDASGRGGRGKGRGGRGVGRGQLSAAAGSSTEPPPTPAPTLFATELPPGWHEAATPEGRPYYYDNGGLTQWERPAAPAAPATPAAPPQQEAAQQAEEPRELLQEEREAEATRGAEAERATSHTKEARERAELRAEMQRLACARQRQVEQLGPNPNPNPNPNPTPNPNPNPNPNPSPNPNSNPNPNPDPNPDPNPNPNPNPNRPWCACSSCSRCT